MKIIYWSGTGNTERMAELISEGLNKEGITSNPIPVDKFNDDLKSEDVIILGCPAMGEEVLEEGEFQPFIDRAKAELKDKKVVLFGSYGWGDGEWMRNWEEEMRQAGASVVLEPLIIQNSPEDELIDVCKEYGRKIAKV